MKKLLFPLFAIAIAFTACKELEEGIEVDVPMDYNVTIPAFQNPDTTITMSETGVETGTKKTVEDAGGSLDDIKSVTLNSIQLTIVSPNTGNFDFVKNASVLVSGPGLNEITLASVDSVADGLTSLDLKTTEESLENYIKASTLDFKVSIASDKALAEDTEIKTRIGFAATVNVVK